MTIDIFLSVGRVQTPDQETFIQSVEKLLAEHDLRPRTVGRTDFTSGKPLETILSVMKECSGTLVIAFERFRFAAGVEFPGSPGSSNLKDVSLPTVWNQIEAGMAYSLGHPLLAVVEANLRDEGLLEDGYDWFVNWVTLTPESLQTDAFEDTFRHWKEKVAAFAGNK